jgi:hypothetical protein
MGVMSVLTREYVEVMLIDLSHGGGYHVTGNTEAHAKLVALCEHYLAAPVAQGEPVAHGESCVDPHEIESCDNVRFNMGKLLTGAANALRGEPEPLHQHSWHDVPELASRAMKALREANELCRSAYQIAEREGKATRWDAFRKRLLESCLRQAEAIHGHEVRADSATCTAKTFRLNHEVTAQPREPLEALELWSFLRNVLEQGRSIQMDYVNGKYPTYEELCARVDEAARERYDELRAAIDMLGAGKDRA